MKTLILMRHAKSDWTKPGQGDKDRTLNPRGRLAASLMGDWLREVGHLPEAALVSAAARTQETFARMKLVCDTQFRDELYLAEAEEILAHIRKAPECDCLLVLGHNPGMESAMGMMADGNRISAPTAATAVYSLPIRRWSDVAFGGASLLAFETPKSLV